MKNYIRKKQFVVGSPRFILARNTKKRSMSKSSKEHQNIFNDGGHRLISNIMSCEEKYIILYLDVPRH